MTGGDRGMSKKLKWSNANEVRRSLAKVCNMVLNDELEESKARTITYCANTLLSSIRIDKQEQEIQELREIVEKIEKDQEE